MAWGPPLECLQHDDSTNGVRECEGRVEWRPALPGGSGSSFPRCEFHWEKALDSFEKFSEAGFGGDVAPKWFDDTAAGERWDDDY